MRLSSALLGIVGVALAAPHLSAQGSLDGAWRVTEVVTVGGPNAGSLSSPQPGIYLFTQQHYSITRITGDQPRPQWPAGATRATITDSQLRETAMPFVASAGRYQVQGSTLTITPLVALEPPYMAGTPDSFQLEMRGNTVVITDTMVTPPATSIRYTLTRVE